MTMEYADSRSVRNTATVRWVGLALLAFSLAVLAAVPTFWLLSREDVNAGSLDAIEAPIETPSEPVVQLAPPPEPASEFSPVASGPQPPAELPSAIEPAPAVPEIPVQSARIADIPDASPAPVSLRIPDIGVRSNVKPVGVDPDSKQVEVPSDRTTVAWYTHSPSPGDAGSAVLTAHVDLNGGPGAFFELRKLEPGAVVTVGYEDGSKQRFEVVARRSYLKDELPNRRIFAQDGKPVLTLITCGGGFNETEREYDSNVVVYAVPADASSKRAT